MLLIICVLQWFWDMMLPSSCVLPWFCDMMLPSHCVLQWFSDVTSPTSCVSQYFTDVTLRGLALCKNSISISILPKGMGSSIMHKGMEFRIAKGYGV